MFSNSPSECPSPVKSKRSTPMPRLASAREIREAAAMSFEHVKQCAKSAVARRRPIGRSKRAASSSPVAPVKVRRWVWIMAVHLWLGCPAIVASANPCRLAPEPPGALASPP